jgi:catechol 2,3-dioxygenase-like lactoylglutathione lyase family enzyme
MSELSSDSVPSTGASPMFETSAAPPATADRPGPALRLKGVDHTARPTWKLAETVRFYRDVMGLELVHTISARGWGPATHPDFLHFFFDSGNGSTIAFFHYLGSTPLPELRDRPSMRPVPDDHVFDATHTAWLVETPDEMAAWKQRLEAAGVEVSAETTHEVIESIYFRDPNGYFVEITRKLRPLEAVDAGDAALTLQAAIELDAEARAAGGALTRIDDVWRRKAELVDARAGLASAAPVRLLVPAVAEFAGLVAAARTLPQARVSGPRDGYYAVEADTALEFHRRELQLKPAVWYGLFTGGLRGELEVFDRDTVRIGPRAGHA